MITSPCPNCDTVAPRMPYDIGSGRELCCAECDWCWGADGQTLDPLPDFSGLPAPPPDGNPDPGRSSADTSEDRPIGPWEGL